MQIIWFRNDLRIHDNPVLMNSIAGSDELLAVYVLDPSWFGTTKFGFPRTGEHRNRFLRESLEELDTQLEKLGSKLHVFEGDTCEVLTQLAVVAGAKRLCSQALAGTEERDIEVALRKELEQQNIEFASWPSSRLFDHDALPFRISDTPDTFTKFRKLVESKAVVAAPLPPPKVVPSISQATAEVIDKSNLQLVPVADLQDHPLLKHSNHSIPYYHGGEQEAFARLQHYFWDSNCIRSYKETRNGLIGLDYSSKFSPWLACGCISPRTIVDELQRYEAEQVKNDSTYWMYFELLWREYFQLMLEKYASAMFHVEGLRGVELPWNQEANNFQPWIDGETGFPFIDANMRELRATGFMSNRGRQNVASFLTKNLGVDWRIGAEWFESQLIDYDPASNYGNWNYAAGVGNDPRGFRWFNTLKQAAQYDPHGEYVRQWIPELADFPDEYIHEPWLLSPVEQRKSGCVIGQSYPEPIVDLFESARRQEELYDTAMARQ